MLGDRGTERWGNLPKVSWRKQRRQWWNPDFFTPKSVLPCAAHPVHAVSPATVLAVTAHEASRASIFLHIENIWKDKKIRKCCICIATSRGSSGACSSISNLVNVPGSWLAYQPPISMSSFPILLTVEECFLPNINLDSSSAWNPPVICLYSGQTQTS